MKNQFGTICAALVVGGLVSACNLTEPASEQGAPKLVAMKMVNRPGQPDLWLTYSRAEGFRFNEVAPNGAVYDVGTKKQAQVSAEADTQGNPFGDLLGDGASGGSAMTFSGGLVSESSFSGEIDTGSGFSGSVGGSSGFTGSVGAATGFVASTLVALGATCDASAFCDVFFGQLCSMEGSDAAECEAAAAECNQQVAATPIPAQAAAAVCAVIDFLNCVFEKVDLAALQQNQGQMDAAALQSCAAILQGAGIGIDNIFGQEQGQ